MRQGPAFLIMAIMRKAAVATLALLILASAVVLAQLLHAPTAATVEKFCALSGWRRLLIKHRIGRPLAYAKTTAQGLALGERLVGTGVELEGVVTGVFGSPDGDYCFDIGDIQAEINPEWRLLHRVTLPSVGQRVRVRGWTFYDITHDDEPVYDPAHPGTRKKRASFWEVHPALEVEVVDAKPVLERRQESPASKFGKLVP